MNIAFLCVLLASLMPYVITLIAKVGGARSGLKYDNRDPRGFLAQLQGWPQRAHSAQQNSWEALPVFAAAVLMASYAGVAEELLRLWALVFVAARVVYVLCYLFNLASLRSLVWAVGLFSCLRLMWAAI